MNFHHPSIWFLLLLLVLPVLWRRWASPRLRTAIVFSTTEFTSAAGSTWAVRWRWIVPALRTAALALLILAMARPQRGDEQTRINTEGVAIQLVVDRSGSMRAQDFTIGNRPTDRLSVVKKVVEEFVAGGKGLPGRPDDVIGMIAFASFADSLCPLTSDHSHLIQSIRQMTVASEREESATAIGDAIALGVERLRALEERVMSGGSKSITGKIMILLTDGENNAGDIDPLTAAQMAAALKIRIYTIGAGTKDAFAPVPGNDIFGRPLRVPVSIDEESLTAIANATGGKYFRATDTDSLVQIYEQIDRLEKTKMHERRFVNYKEAAVESLTVGPVTLPPLLAIVLGLLLIEALLSNTRFRTVP